MAQFNVSTGQDTYYDDFGNTYEKIPNKFGGNIPINIIGAMEYKVIDGFCKRKLPFTRRHLIVEMENGSTHKLPLESIGFLKNAFANLSQIDGILCIHLVGEKWNNLAPSYVNANATFKTGLYKADDIPKKKITTAYQYTYESDLIGQYQTGTRIEVDPGDLHNCQKAGLLDPIIVPKLICNQNYDIKERRFFIRAMTDKPSEVKRQAIVSLSPSAGVSNIASVYETAAPCSFCIGYEGESARNIELLLKDLI